MNFKQSLSKVKAFAFDVDGVLSPISIPTAPDGEPLRMVNVRDGYAIRMAILRHYPIAIITGGRSQGVVNRYNGLGVTEIYLGSAIKCNDFDKFLANNNLKDEDVLFMGDDIPDYPVMKRAGIATCPADAAPEIKDIADYVSLHKGGDGCVRDVIEQVLKVQGHWMDDIEAFGW